MTLIEKNQHPEAMAALVGRQRAPSLLENLMHRGQKGYWFFSKEEQIVLVAVGAGSTATFLVTNPTSENDQQNLAVAIGCGLTHLSKKYIDLAQSVCQPDEYMKIKAYKDAGFISLAILKYLERKKRFPEPTQKAGNVTWVTMADYTDKALGKLLKESYINSQDCPLIHGKRKIQDVISGHRGGGEYDPNLWSILSVGDSPVGIILLNKSQTEGCMELAYLGVVPDSRGKGFGHDLMQRAVKQSQANGCDRITLAVDAQNENANALYQKWGFREVGKRHTLICGLC